MEPTLGPEALPRPVDPPGLGRTKGLTKPCASLQSKPSSMWLFRGPRTHSHSLQGSLSHPIALRHILSVVRNDRAGPSSSYRTSLGSGKGWGNGSNNSGGTKTQPWKATSAISHGLSICPTSTQRALGPPEGFRAP